jgi:N-acetylglucosamine-6-sulfatase
MQVEDRRPGAKHIPYDEASRIPLLVRGLGIAPGTRVSELAFNTHFFTKLADIAGAPADWDGRSLLPLLNGSAPTTWRQQLTPRKSWSYYEIRRERYKYVEWEESDTELYDLQNDSYELRGIQTNKTTDPALVEDLKAKLEALNSRAVQSCRETEYAP